MPAGSELLPQPIERTSAISLRYDQSVFTLEFAALGYQSASKTLFQHQLVGFDKDWSPPRSGHQVTYTNLSPGDYRLQVRAVSQDGQFTGEPAEIAIHISPPWWNTWAFHLGSFVLIIVLVGSIVQLRLSRSAGGQPRAGKRVPASAPRSCKLPSSSSRGPTQSSTVQIEQITRLQQELQEQAIHDPLTGLYNRRYLSEMLEAEFNRASCRSYAVAFLLIDLDHFKVINDTFGHQAGDLALEQVARLLIEHTRRSDIACRYGGEEFLCALGSVTDKGDVLKRTEQLPRCH